MAAAREQPARRTQVGAQQEDGRDRHEPDEGLTRQQRRRDRDTGDREGAETAGARVRMDALEGHEREQEREVVREQRERGPEHVRREHEQQRQRERLPALERRGPAQQAQQRERHPVREEDVEQAQLPELEADELAPPGGQHVVERRLGGRVVGEVEPLGELQDRGQLVHARIGAVERLDLHGQALQHRDPDQEGEREQAALEPVEPRGLRHPRPSRRRPSGHVRRSGQCAQSGERALQVRRPWRISSTCVS